MASSESPIPPSPSAEEPRQDDQGPASNTSENTSSVRGSEDNTTNTDIPSWHTTHNSDMPNMTANPKDKANNVKIDTDQSNSPAALTDKPNTPALSSNKTDAVADGTTSSSHAGVSNGGVNGEVKAVNGNGGGEGGGDTTEIDIGEQKFSAPDGGYGWVIVMCALIVSLIVDGLTYTFGVLLGHLENAFGASKSTVALANSLQVGMYLVAGPVVSALTNRFGCRPVIISGSLVAGLAYLISSWSQNVAVLIVTYGFFGGLGFGLMYLPSIVSVSVYFEEKRALATGIAVCGSGVGMFVLAPLTELLVDTFNWRWTLVLLSGLVFNGMVFGAMVRPLKVDNSGSSGPQMIGSGDDEDIHNHYSSNKKLSNSPRSRQASEASASAAGGAGGRHRTMSSASGVSAKDINSEAAIPLMPLVEGVESITVEVLEEPMGKRGKHPRTTSEGPGSDSHTNRLLLPSGSAGPANYSSSPAINHTSVNHRRPSEGAGHLSKAVSSASELLQRLQLSASHQTLDPASRQLRARTPLGLSVVSLAASSAHLSQEIHRSRSRVGSFDKHATTSKPSSSCLDCLSPDTRSIITEMLNFSILKNSKYWFVLMGNFFCMIGFYVPFVYIPQRAVELGIEESKAAFLLSIIGISNTLGRVLVGLIVQCLSLNCVLVTTVALVISGAVTIMLPWTEDYITQAALSAVFGLCVAAYIALCSVLLCDLLGVNNLTNAFGYVILFRGVACIIGPPLAGAIIDSTGMFDPAFYLGGGMIVLGGLSHLMLYLLYTCPCLSRDKKMKI